MVHQSTEIHDAHMWAAKKKIQNKNESKERLTLNFVYIPIKFSSFVR